MDVYLLLSQEGPLEQLGEGKTATTQLVLLNPYFALSISPPRSVPRWGSASTAVAVLHFETV